MVIAQQCFVLGGWWSVVGKVTAVDSCFIFVKFNADVINPLTT